MLLLEFLPQFARIPEPATVPFIPGPIGIGAVPFIPGPAIGIGAVPFIAGPPDGVGGMPVIDPDIDGGEGMLMLSDPDIDGGDGMLIDPDGVGMETEALCGMAALRDAAMAMMRVFEKCIVVA